MLISLFGRIGYSEQEIINRISELGEITPENIAKIIVENNAKIAVELNSKIEANMKELQSLLKLS
ncbi:hypothetical protein [Phascolarctobacterium faecium]|mgnify:FL=1|jgi:hypothetical protein|uniref:hypothetical protein n=1 Tax=Phascolarctobacterium faecium TaxID=33025 RepID=UPI0020577B43|nr:MAG TPA: hypothetical protein [Caudoviricetes sp.]